MSIEKQLKDLERLKQKGVITDEEYQSRRSAIVSSADVQKKGGVVGGIFKWGAVGCLSIVGGFIVLIILIVVVISLAVKGSSSTLQDGHGDFAQGGTATAQTAGGVKVNVTINTITDPATSTNQFEQPKAGHHYLTVAVTIQNVGQAQTSAGEATLRTTDGTEYKPTFVSGVGANDLSFFQSLTSGGKTNGVVAFEVADGAHVQWLKFDPNPFANGDIYFDAK
jgi:hypothetical protein